MKKLKPIRILQVVTVMNRGGLETMLMNYYRKIDRSKIQFDFMVHRDEKGDYDDEIVELGGTIYKMPSIRPGHYVIYFKKLNHFFNHHREYKVVHAHINENSSFVLRAAKKAGVPSRIAHSHLSDLGFDHKLPFRLYARLLMQGTPNDYFACSEKAGQWLFGRKTSAFKKIKVLKNAVDVNKFSFNKMVREKIRYELQAENKLVIGHIGRFNKQKNHDFLIDIYKEIYNKNPHSMLVLAGDGHLRESIENKVSNSGLAGNVKFLGLRNDIADLMQGFDLFLLPSLFEGLPVVLVEAQAAGLNCITSDSVTKEADITGRLDFMSLKQSPAEWANTILYKTIDHADTSAVLRNCGYDSGTTAGWLTRFYFEKFDEPIPHHDGGESSCRL